VRENWLAQEGASNVVGVAIARLRCRQSWSGVVLLLGMVEKVDNLLIVCDRVHQQLSGTFVCLGDELLDPPCSSIAISFASLRLPLRRAYANRPIAEELGT
jgi:hypothetical protein